MAIDYGTKRTGLAVTDPLQLIANGLDTVSTNSLIDFLDDYLEKEEVETIVVGEPLHDEDAPAHIAHLVIGLVRKLRKRFPALRVTTVDERFTSEEAKKIILQSGAGRKKRQQKELVDKVSATLILDAYMRQAGLW